MFIGLIQDVGRVESIVLGELNKRFIISTNLSLSDVRLGESISVNGVCLTVIDIQEKTFSVQAVQETLKKSSLNQLSLHAFVNLELAARIGDPIGGHMVQGHVDSTGKILNIKAEGDAWHLTITFPKFLRAYLVEKGSIAIDGMSITVIEVLEDAFTITLIPYTLQNTVAQYYQVGVNVNLEADIFAKHIYQILHTRGFLGART